MPLNTPRTDSVSPQRVLLLCAAFVVVVAGMKAASTMLVPFLLSVFIAVISAPLLFWLTNHGFSKGMALLVVLLSIFTITTSVALLVGSSVAGFLDKVPVYKTRLQDESSTLLAWLQSYGIDFSTSTVLQYFDPGYLMQMVANMLSGFGNVLANSFLILLTVAFILMEASSFPSKLRHIYQDPRASLRGFSHFTDTLKRYVEIKTLVSFGTGLSISLFLLVLGVDFALLWGMLAFLLNFVPNIGSIIAAVPAVLVAFVELGLGTAALTLGGYLVSNTVFGNIVEPRFMGRGLGLSTLVVFLSLVFWGWILGPVGMLLSVPLTVTMKIALEHNPDTQWLAILLGSEHDHDDHPLELCQKTLDEEDRAKQS